MRDVIVIDPEGDPAAIVPAVVKVMGAFARSFRLRCAEAYRRKAKILRAVADQYDAAAKALER